MEGRILVVAPHPDDEVLGAGGTIARAVAGGQEVFVVIATRAYPPHFDADLVARGRAEAALAHALLGVRETFAFDFPAAALDTVDHRDMNAAFGRLVREVRPDVLLLPFPGDIHRDHQLVFESALVAARPNGGVAPRRVYCYETLSETNWNAPFLTPGFQPNVFVDVSEHVETKVRAMETYASQVQPFPHERSAEAIRALAALRGSTIGVRAAEAFVLVREIR